MKNIEQQIYLLQQKHHLTPPEILICFDIDYTLMTSVESCGHYTNIMAYKDEFLSFYDSMTIEEQIVLLNLANTMLTPKLVDKEAPKNIANLLYKGFQAIALTGSITGKLGKITSMENWRYRVLRDLEIDFSSVFPQHDYIEFSDMPSFLGSIPVFYKGILMASTFHTAQHSDYTATKGSVLVKFLQLIDYMPKLVVFIDDSEKYLDEVGSTLSHFDTTVEYQGIHYTKGLQYGTRIVSKDKFMKFWWGVAKDAKQIVSNYRRTK